MTHRVSVLDTGAGPNIINARCIPRQWHQYIRSVKTPRLVSASKTAMPVLGVIELMVRIGSLHVRIQFLVVANLVADMILGTTFIDRYVKAILPGHRKVVFNDAPSVAIIGETKALGLPTPTVTDKLLTNKKESPSVPSNTVSKKIRVARPAVLPPMTQCQVWVQTDVGGLSFLQNHPKLAHKHLTLMENGVMDVLPKQKFQVLVSNFSDKTVRLSKNTIVGLAFPAPAGIMTMDTLKSKKKQPPTVSVEPQNGQPPAREGEGTESEVSWQDEVHIGTEDEELREQVMDLLAEFQDMWSGHLGTIDAVKHRIELTPGARPIHQAPYRAGHKAREIEKKEIDRMLAAKVIEEAQSEWASPVVLIPKKDGSMRFCVDYRRLNAITVRDAYPLPRMDEYIDSLGDATVFTTLDANSGYWQVEMAEEDRDKTTFVSHYGMYRFIRMPFGLTNAPATFQRALDIILSRVKWRFALVYIDDIIVYSKTVSEHFHPLREVLTLLRAAGVSLKISKCAFFDEEVEYLGHVVKPGRLEMQSRNTDAIRRARPPTNITELRSFLGMCNVYRRFVPNFARVAAPLTRLTGKGMPQEFETLTDEEFEALKKWTIDHAADSEQPMTCG